VSTAPNRVDILIITAIKEELDALLEVDADGSTPWSEVDGELPYHTATLDGRAGPIHVAAARPVSDPDDTDLGDVVIADRVFQHDEGKLTSNGFEGDLRTHVVDDRWLHAAQNLEGAATTLHGFAQPDEEAARRWFLSRLVDERNPRKSAFHRYFPPGDRRAERLTSLLEAGHIVEEGEGFALTDAGRSTVVSYRRLHGAAPRTLPFHAHVGPIGSGSYVEASGHIWDRLERPCMLKIKAVEMEAAAIGRVAHGRRLPFVVAKGVMDHADPKKVDGYKPFAARASAEVLCSFLRRAVQPPRVETFDGDEDPRPDIIPANELRRYLKRIEGEHEYIKLGGFDTKFRAPLKLNELYVDLDAIINSGIRGQAIHASDQVVQDDKAKDPTRSEKLPLSRAFTRARQLNRNGLVLLGDPGSGKTTHLKQVLLKVVRGRTSGDVLRLPPTSSATWPASSSCASPLARS